MSFSSRLSLFFFFYSLFSTFILSSVVLIFFSLRLFSTRCWNKICANEYSPVHLKFTEGGAEKEWAEEKKEHISVLLPGWAHFNNQLWWSCVICCGEKEKSEKCRQIFFFHKVMLNSTEPLRLPAELLGHCDIFQNTVITCTWRFISKLR